MIEFSDGMKFDTSGEWRVEQRADGLYVVGHGMLMAVDSQEQGEGVILMLSTKRTGGGKA